MRLLPLCLVLTACGSPTLKDPGSGDMHSTSQPASIWCIIAVCDVVLADRATRAKGDADATGDIEAEQKPDVQSPSLLKGVAP